MELKRGWNGEYTQYCYLYEAYFKSPVYVDSDFYIFGSEYCNYPGSSTIIHTVYRDIMDFGGYALREGCEREKYEDIINSDYCRPQGGWVGVRDNTFDEWYTPWPDSPFGYYLAIVDQWDLEAVPDSAEHGDCAGRKALCGAERPRQRQLQHQIRTAAAGSLCPDELVKAGALPSLHIIAGHDADSSHIPTESAPALLKQV
jgi:hypothetical protein